MGIAGHNIRAMPDDALDPWKDLGRQVRRRRRTLHLGSQVKTATTANVGIDTWGKLERGDQPGYKDFTLERVCEVLRWTPDSIDRILRGEPPILRGASEPTVDRVVALAEKARSLAQELVETQAQLAEELSHRTSGS